MNLFFETQSGSTFSIEVGYWDTVLEIKQKIEKFQGVPVSKQTLFFQGDCLLQDDLDVEQCKIFHNSRLQVFVSPFRNANPNRDQVPQIKQSPVSSNSVGDIIYGQDLPLTTEHFMNIQDFYVGEITPVMVGINKNNNQMLQTEQSPRLKSAEQIINDQDLPVTVQVLQTEQSPLSNSVKEIINLQDSPVNVRSTEKVPKRIKVGSNNNNNDQVLQTEECPPLNTVKEIVNIQESPVKVRSNNNNTQVLQTEQSPPSNSIKEITNIPDSPWKPLKVKHVPMRMTVFVLPYSGESKAASKIPVDVNPRDNVETLRKELVKIQQTHQLNLPQEGYFFIHRQSKMDEDQTFWWNGVIHGDTIEISPGHVKGSKKFLSLN